MFSHDVNQIFIFNIGIKHVFPCINIRWVPREVFNIARGTKRMLMHGKTCSLLLHKSIEKVDFRAVFRCIILALFCFDF